MYARQDRIFSQRTINQGLSLTQLWIMMAISSGHGRETNIRRVVRIARDSLERQLNELEERGMIEREGLIFRNWKLTDRGMNVLLNSYATAQIGIPQVGFQTPNHRIDETRVTTTFGTVFKATLGVIFGIFIGIVLVGFIASLIFWAGYSFLIKNYIPPQLLPYVPFDNLLVDIIWGLLISIALFIPLRNRLGLGLQRR